MEQRQLRFLRSTAEQDLILEIGYRQSENKPLTAREIILLDFGSVATIRRCLRRLRAHGAIRQRRRKGDRRVLELHLAPRVLGIYAKYEQMLAASAQYDTTREIPFRASARADSESK